MLQSLALFEQSLETMLQRLALMLQAENLSRFYSFFIRGEGLDDGLILMRSFGKTKPRYELLTGQSGKRI